MILIVLLVLVGCGKQEVNTVEAIQKRGELILLTELLFHPLNMHQMTHQVLMELMVLILEFGKALADSCVTLGVVDMDFDSLTVALQAGKGDIVAAGMTVNPERSNVVDF